MPSNWLAIGDVGKDGFMVGAVAVYCLIRFGNRKVPNIGNRKVPNNYLPMPSISRIRVTAPLPQKALLTKPMSSWFAPSFKGRENEVFSTEQHPPGSFSVVFP